MGNYNVLFWDTYTIRSKQKRIYTKDSKGFHQEEFRTESTFNEIEHKAKSKVGNLSSINLSTYT